MSIGWLFGAGLASGGQIVLTFSGTISQSVNSISSTSLLGQPFSGSATYDSNDPILSVGGPIPVVTSAYSFGPLDLLTLTIGGFTFSASGSAPGNSLFVEYHQINGGAAYDYFAMSANLSSISSNVPGFLPTLLSIDIAGVPGLLTAPGLPQNFDFSNVVSGGLGGRPTSIFVGAFPPSGGSPIFLFRADEFTSLQIRAVPEPATGSLLASVLIALVLRRAYGRIGGEQG